MSNSFVEGIQVMADVTTLTAARTARNHGLIRHARAYAKANNARLAASEPAWLTVQLGGPKIRRHQSIRVSATQIPVAHVIAAENPAGFFRRSSTIGIASRATFHTLNERKK